jgi:hypothetical protein
MVKTYCTRTYLLLAAACLPLSAVNAFLSFVPLKPNFDTSYYNSVKIRNVNRLQLKMTAVTSTTSTTSSAETNASKSIGAIGSTLTDKELAWEAIRKFVDETNVIAMEPTKGGVNNIVQYITLKSGRKLLLRIYNNGFDTPKVEFEHELLRQLNLLQANSQNKFSFQVRNKQSGT